jgi:S-DNA-T family DNA segregation ATPase FtsK/SpoIIIE
MGNGKQQKKQEKKAKFDLSEDIKHSIYGVLFACLGFILLLSIFGLGGVVGEKIIYVFDIFFGVGTYLIPAILFMVAAVFLLTLRANIYFSNYLGAVLMFLSIIGIFDIIDQEQNIGGIVGKGLSYVLESLLGFWASLVFLFAVFAISLSLSLNISFKIKKREKQDGVELSGEEQKTAKEQSVAEEKKVSEKIVVPESAEILEQKQRKEKKQIDGKNSKTPVFERNKEVEKEHYPLPPLDLLEGDKGNPSAGDIKAYSNIIRNTLSNFGIEVEMGEINIGPTVTQYTFKPAQGVKLSRITTLQNDLALSLAAHPIRIEAPIPGRSLVGIEIPNKAVTFVRLRNLLEDERYVGHHSPLLLALGRDVAGKPIYADLARMPHLLIAGATGTGKSVCIHSILTSFLFRNYPDLVKFIIVDPKRVELSDYNNIPHLLTPVITDKNKAIGALQWAVREMEKRYQILSEHGTRDIASYNDAVSRFDDCEIMPYIVIVIDELADLMMASPREVESSIVRLAQMARAVGIHLIVSTQRPSVEVITGLIKANIVSRIAFQVASQVDSRTILDMSGAEKLLGNGDMLYVSAEYMKPKRIQAAFLMEKEVKKVVGYLKKYAKGEDVDHGEFEENIKKEMEHLAGHHGEGGADGNTDDALYEEAKKEVLRMQKASASLLQRRLRVGYARAARLLDLLEENGVIGPGEGAKPRKVHGSSAEGRSGEIEVEPYNEEE